MKDFNDLTPEEVDVLVARVQETTGRSESDVRDALVDIMMEERASRADAGTADEPVEEPTAEEEKDAFTSILNTLGSVTRNAGDKIGEVAGKVRDVINDPVKQAELRDKASQVAHDAGEKVTGVVNQVKDKLAADDDTVDTPVDDAVLDDPVAEEPDAVEGTEHVDWRGVADKLTHGAGKAARSVRDAAQGFVNGYKDYMAKPEVQNKLNGIKDAFLSGYHEKDNED